MPVVSVGQLTITDVNDGLSLVLSNNAHTVPTDSSGNSPVLTGAVSTAKVLAGGVDISSQFVITAVNSVGVAGSYVSNTYTVSGLTVDVGTVDFTATRAGSDTLTARFTITKAKQGSAGSPGLNGITIVMSNEAHTFPASSAGVVSSYANSGTTVQVYEGSTLLNAVSGATSNGSFSVGVATQLPASTITVGAISHSSTTATIAVHSAMVNGTDAVSLTFPITIKRANGTTSTVNKVQVLTKSKQGATGVGTQGPRGSVHLFKDIAGSVWLDSETDSLFVSAPYNPKQPADRVTLKNSTAKFSETRAWTGTAWAIQTEVLDGSLLVTDSVTANAINTTSLYSINAEISGSLRVGNNDNYVQLGGDTFLRAQSGSEVLFSVPKSGRGLLQGGSLVPASVLGEALSADAIDKIRIELGGMVNEFGGSRSTSVYLQNGTYNLPTLKSANTAVSIAFYHLGASTISTNTANPSVTVIIRRGPTTVHSQTFTGGSYPSYINQGTQMYTNTLPQINLTTNDATPGTGDIIYSVQVTVNNYPGFNAGNFTFSISQQATGGTQPVAQIPDLPASKITSGTFAVGLIPTAISITGNAATATTAANATALTTRSFTLSGVTATAQNFNGTGNVTIPITAVPATLLTGNIPDARLTGSYTGLTNLTGSGTVDFAKFFGNAGDMVSAPSFSWTGDTDTGIYSPAANELAITTGGVQRALFNSLGLTTNELRQGTYIRSHLHLPNPGGNLGAGRWFVRLFPTTAATFIGGRIRVGGSWSWADIMGVLEREFGYYVSTNATTVTSGTSRISAATSSAANNLRIGELTIESGWAGFYVWSSNSNSIEVQLDLYCLGQTLPTPTFVAWAANALPVYEPVSFVQVSSPTFLGNAADSVSAPSFTWANDINTGLYQPSVDQMAITTGGVQRALFNSSGVTATTFIGALSGNATTATTLQTVRTINGTNFNGSINITTANWGTARTITVGSTGKSVNGAGNISWSLAEIGAPSTSGVGAVGSWGIDVSGTANGLLLVDTATRNLSNRLPNGRARSLSLDFVSAGTVGGSGNYGGVITFSPWDGTTASTGDSSYQLAFLNRTGVNSSGIPDLKIRNGIDTTWKGWYTILHDGNFGSYALPLSGGTMTGRITTRNIASSWIGGFNGNEAIQIGGTATTGSFHGWLTQRTPNGGWAQGILGDALYFNYAIASNINTSTNTISSQIRFNSNGDVNATDFISTSDIRTKSDLLQIHGALDKLGRIKGYTFMRRGAKIRDAGFIAQELEIVLPEGVKELDGLKRVSNSAVIGLLIEAVNELRKEVTGLRNGTH